MRRWKVREDPGRGRRPLAQERGERSQSCARLGLGPPDSGTGTLNCGWSPALCLCRSGQRRQDRE